ncbi:PD-(D/E)XK nuclease family protein [Salinibacterium sp. ZJ454]|uniref:PD-(D/E)XK nuclease family protein n=1 Tax=Salinibacterium sp. ZJ454 TaxID=2708339 RepID=UPI001AB05A8E|nr:PD-(D/E)XK nuclease family protein [Salinibacterium sp. ZJ454]
MTTQLDELAAHRARRHSVHTTADGFATLTELVAAAKQNDPLGRVTILVPSHTSGLDATRHLARTVNGGRGVLNVHAMTLADVASQLHTMSGEASGRSLATRLVREGAVRSMLAEQPGLFEAVAAQPATARALAAASDLLDAASTADTETSELTREVLRVHRGVRERLAPHWFTFHDGAIVATRMIQTDADVLGRTFGTIIGFLLPHVHDLGADERHLLAAVRQAAPFDDITIHTIGEPAAPRMISTTDPDEEARAVARLVVEKIRQSTPAHRIGVFWASADPYRALLHRHLAEAGITVNGPAARQLADTALVRGILTLLTLDPADVDLRVVLDVLAEGALSWSVEPLPSSARCERLYGETLLSDPEDRDEQATDEPADAPTVQFVDLSNDASTAPGAKAFGTKDWQQHRLSDRLKVQRHLVAVSDSLVAVADARSWAAAISALDGMVVEHFAPRDTMPNEELQRARDGLLAAIAELAGLDGIAPPPRSISDVRAALETAVDKPQSHNKAGVGVSLGSLRSATARDLDVVIAVGLAEGIAPARHREDPLLPDGFRSQVGLPTVTERAAREHRAFRRSLASAQSEAIALWPRGDLRAGGEREPSRWLSGLVEISDQKVQDVATHIGSYHDAILTGAPVPDGPPITAQQWRLRRLQRPEHDRPDAPAEPSLDAAWAMRHDRRHGLFTPFTGNVSAVADCITVLDAALTASSMEDWVASPLSFFLARVLGVRMFQRVDLAVEIDRLQRGELLHAVLERHTVAVMDSADDSLDALLTIAEHTFDEYRAMPEARNWLDHLWRRDMRSMRTDLRLWWERHLTDGWDPHSAEAAFGLKDAQHQSVEFDLNDGSTIRFAGKVDRIDWGEDGGIRVVDYKAGKSGHFADLGQENPTAGGTRFQLPIYGMFAQREAEEAGRSGAARADYDFITRAGGQTTIGYAITDEVIDTLREDLTRVVGAIREGLFPPVPLAGSFESFTTMIGATGMQRQWESMVELIPQTPELHEIARLWVDENEEMDS